MRGKVAGEFLPSSLRLAQDVVSSQPAVAQCRRSDQAQSAKARQSHGQAQEDVLTYRTFPKQHWTKGKRSRCGLLSLH